jgi:cytochrome c-type biogenesis protein CcmH/NrfG
LWLHRPVEAEQAARAALRADGLSGRARYYLALSLLEQNKAKAEARFDLERAGPQFEPARHLLEQLQNEATIPP